jgi:7,8-dihydropterin-6-yl-methyl-4-(beta-D-ribofuranosyl)aminobenzene 5'-phosphate synthase
MKRLSQNILLAFCFAAVSFGQTQAPTPKALPVLPGVDITVLVENMAGNPSVLGEWGLAYLIETGGHRILFDTGLGQTLFGNAQAMKIDLGRIEAVVISHGHSDHTGGLEKTLEVCGPVDLFIHPGAFAARYWKEGSKVGKEDNPVSRDQLRRQVRALHETIRPEAVCGGVMVTGEVPRRTEFEDTGTGGFFFIDSDLKTPDLILDDQALFFRIPEGVVIILGCAHAGVVNTIQYVSQLTGEDKICAVMGGTHLLSASADRLQKTIAAFRQYDLQKIMLCHCTGMKAFTELATAIPGRCSWPAAGSKVHFGGK